jgi:hypothetical protein
MSCGGTDSADLEEATAALDRFFVAWNAQDPEAMSVAFADEFYFKGFGPFHSVRTDTASMTAYLEALGPEEVRLERASDVTMGESGIKTVEAIVTDSKRSHLARMQLEIDGGRISRLVTVSWETIG